MPRKYESETHEVVNGDPVKGLTKSDGESLTVDELRTATGTSMRSHAAAAVLHGWTLHAHHEGAPLRLTVEQYRNAVKAAVASKSEPKPVADATSQHLGKRL